MMILASSEKADSEQIYRLVEAPPDHPEAFVKACNNNEFRDYIE